MAGDDPFEALLKRCGERLSEIRLSVPDLEKTASRPAARLSLSPPEAPPPPLPRAARPEPRPPLPEIPIPPEAEEIEVFPPAAAPAPAPTPEPRSKPNAGMPETSQHPRPRSRALFVAAAAGLVIAALGFWASRRDSGAIEIALPGADAAAVRPDGGDMLVARGAELLAVSRAGKTLSRGVLNGRIAGLYCLQNSAWSVDGANPEVTEWREGERPIVFRLNHVPQAIFAQGNDLWTVEKGGHAIHQYIISRSIMGAMLQPLDLFEVPDLTAESIAIDGTGTLWVIDDETRALYRLRAQGGVYKIVDQAPLSPLLGPAGSLRGLTLDGDAVWIFLRPAEGGAAVLRRIPLRRLAWTPA